MLIEMPRSGMMDNKCASSPEALAPVARASGQHRGKRFIRAGRSPLQQARYMPALVAMRFEANSQSKPSPLPGDRHGSASQRRGWCWRHFAGSIHSNRVGRDQVRFLLDHAEIPQLLAAGVVVTAGRLETCQGRYLAPGEAARRVLDKGRQQLARGWMKRAVAICAVRIRLRHCLASSLLGLCLS